MDGFLTSTEAAKRLGVKVSTLYVYVSRGLIHAERAPDGRRSLFAVEDIEALANRSRNERPSETRLATINTQITQITPEGPNYRGVPAVSLVRTPFEEVAALIWRVPPREWKPRKVRSLGRLQARDLIRATVALTGASDALRSDRREEAVILAAEGLISTVVQELTRSASSGRGQQGSVADRLASWMCPDPARPLVDAVNAALVLLADHEIATSTLAVRLAASTRADLYDAILAGLGVVGGPLHGGNSELAYGLLERAAAVGIERALDEELRWRSRPPGFGVAVYADRDPRFDVMRPLLDELLRPKDREMLDALLSFTAGRFPAPNIDLALAALGWSVRADASVGPTLFSVARIAGWTAHYLEELAERSLRFRARAIYVSGAQPD